MRGSEPYLRTGSECRKLRALERYLKVVGHDSYLTGSEQANLWTGSRPRVLAAKK